MTIFYNDFNGIPAELVERLVALIVECQDDPTIGRDMYIETAFNIMAQYELTTDQEHICTEKIEAGWQSVTDTRSKRGTN